MKTFLLAIIALFTLSLSAQAATYYVANNGDDAGPGTSPEKPWATIDRVKRHPLAPGDVVRFRRGDRWREQLRPKSGDASAPMTYTAYGEGPKPLLLGSVDRSQAEDWKHEGGNVWSTGSLARDVGNIIFDREASCGVKVWNEADLKEQGQYWYDEEKKVLKLYSATSPAQAYSRIECALREHIIDESRAHHVVFDALALKYGAAHGIGGYNTHHITVRNCDFGFIGGGDQRGGEHTVRFGNGVEFWAGAHDNLVEHCRLWEIYDAALTNQNSGSVAKQYNITYRNNVIWNSEYSFEYWNRPAESETSNIRFENNTCVAAGGGWGHAQRPDPSGRHLCFYTSPARARDLVIRGNVFYQSTGNVLYAPGWSTEAVKALKLDANCWYQPEGAMVLLKGARYTMDQFSEFQAAYGLSLHAVVADPRLIDPAEGHFKFREDTPCPTMGATPWKTR